MKFPIVLLFLCIFHCLSDQKAKRAIVTLVMGENSGNTTSNIISEMKSFEPLIDHYINPGYSAGALALGQSLNDVGTKLDMIAMVTPDINDQTRKQLAALWTVHIVDPVYCNHKHNLDPTKYDLRGEKYQEGISRWSTSCTKFRAWGLTDYDRVIFMDSDMLVVGEIDDAMDYGNATFYASPESFPPDNFNSGFMVIKPSKMEFQRLLEINEHIGSTEGGDQGVLNNGYCPQWFTASSTDTTCGRLPWLYNVQAAYYTQYKTLREMNGMRVPSVIHFVSDGKPWKVLMYEYLPGVKPPPETIRELGKQAHCHLLWRDAFFRATGERPSNNHFLLSAVAALNSPPQPDESAGRSDASANQVASTHANKTPMKGKSGKKNKSTKAKMSLKEENL